MKAEYHKLKSWADRLSAGGSAEQVAVEMTRFLRDMEKKGAQGGISDGIDQFMKQLKLDIASARLSLDWYSHPAFEKWQEKLTKDAINAMIENVRMQTTEDQRKVNCAVFESSIKPILAARQIVDEAEAMATISELAGMAFKQLVERRNKKI